MSDQEKIFLSIGSNIHDKYENMKKCLNILDNHPHIWLIHKSHIYQTPPLYNTKQEDFFNMVIQIETNLIPIDLLHQLKAIELKIGRNMINQKNSPRVIDLDILVYGQLEINTKILKIPHPEIINRKFVLKPWNDIDSNFFISKYSRTIKQLLNDTNDKSIIKRMLIIDNENIV